MQEFAKAIHLSLQVSLLILSPPPPPPFRKWSKVNRNITYTMLVGLNEELSHAKIFTKCLGNMSIIQNLLYLKFGILEWKNVHGALVHCCMIWMTLMFPRGFVNIFSCGGPPLLILMHPKRFSKILGFSETKTRKKRNNSRNWNSTLQKKWVNITYTDFA